MTMITGVHTRKGIPFWRDERVLNAAAQVISAVIVIGLVYWMIVNFMEITRQRGMLLSYQFLKEPAGFPIAESSIPYDPTMSFGRAFMVGLINTLRVSVLGILFATLLGFFVGLARLSSNWLFNRIALAFIEFHRNIPLLVLLFLWYFSFFSKLPPVKASITLPGPIYINQRGLYLAWPRLTETGNIFMFSIGIGILLASIAWVVLRRRRERTGKSTYFGAVSLGLLILAPTIGWFAAGGTPLLVGIPTLQGFNFKGGLRLTPEFAGMLLGLSLYTAAFIAEAVRSGIQAVQRGQVEAAKAIGLSNYHVLSLIVIPQAMRVIIPPLISQYLNLTKNSSLALAIGFQELFAVGKITINQAGRAIPVFIMVMATYLAMSLFTSLVLNSYNRRIQFIEK
ncbi:MAG: ABC transporter permease subunit [Anaerolineales bacterium]|nr:ABC transporter permease subunit [Anaerolineales bacterium]